MCFKRLFKAIYIRYISHDLGSLLFHNLEVAMNIVSRGELLTMQWIIAIVSESLKNRRKINCREVSKKLLLSCKGDKTQDDLQWQFLEENVRTLSQNLETMSQL